MKLLLIFLFAIQARSIYVGKSINSRIIGGDEAFAGEFPAAAAIYKTTAEGNYFCTGSILSRDWVITAGQCIDGALSFTILIGTHKLDGDEATVEKLATGDYVLHPDFNPSTLENDIGLIKFRARIDYNDYVQQVYLPAFDFINGTGTAYGWGQTTDDGAGLSNVLQTVTLEGVTNDECRITYGSQLTDNMICFAGNYNEGTCLGDSGGPLIQPHHGYNMIYGVSSFFSANGCESPDPSGYTRVFPYVDWIQNITGFGSPM